MGSLSNSLQIKGFYQTQGTATAPGKITIGFTRIKTILGMTEKEIGKGPGNQNVGQILGLHEKEAGAKPDSTTGKPSRNTGGGIGGGGESSSARKDIQGK
jgi:hypothetical protein